jgi:pimeloyl-ACP methyl ester carboxylesterase
MRLLSFIFYVVIISGCKSVKLNQSVLFFPVTIADYSSFKHLREFNIRDSSGNLINGIEIDKPNRKSVILYFHGNSGSIWEKDFERIVKNIDSLNLDMIAIDYTGYGKSLGSPSITSLYSNAAATYEYAIKKYSPDSIIIWGFSLGSIPTSRLAREGKGVKIIIESGLTYDREILTNVMKNNTNSFQRLFINFQMESTLIFSPQEDIKQSKQPFLFIHGELDKTVTYTQAMNNFEYVSNTYKRFYLVKNVGHNETDYNIKEYYKIIDNYLQNK